MKDSNSAARYKVGSEEGLRLLLQEMDEAGVDQIVIPGRKITQLPEVIKGLTDLSEINVSDEMLVE